jgi:hypothetical protein
VYEDHPLWIATKQILTEAYIDLATALRNLDSERIDEERLNIIGLRESAVFVFSDKAFDLDFSALCGALTVLEPITAKPN